MAIQSQPSRISEPFAGSGTKNTIPATNSTPSASQAASWAAGFPPECSQPISAGGCPVPRNDMNGVLNQISQDYSFRQDGGVWEWSALADYDLQRIVRGSDGVLYCSAAQSGPGLVAGAQDPTADDGTYWGPVPVATPAVSASANEAVTAAWVKSIAAAPVYMDPAGSDSNDGMSAAAPVQTFARAIQIASAMSQQGMRFIVAAGTYVGNLELSNNNLVLETQGAVSISGHVEIKDKAACIVSGSGTLSITGYVYIYSQAFFLSECQLSISSSSRAAIEIEDSSCFDIRESCSVTASDVSNAIYISNNSFFISYDTVAISATNTSAVIRGARGALIRFLSSVTIGGSGNGNAISVSDQCILSSTGSVIVNSDCVTSYAISLDGAVATFYSQTSEIHGSTTSNTSIVYVTGRSYLSLSSGAKLEIHIHNTSGRIIYLYNNSCMDVAGSSSIVYVFEAGATARYLIDVWENSTVSVGSYATINFGTGSVVGGTVDCTYNSVLAISASTTLSGTITGKRFAVDYGGQINVNGAGDSRIPGSAAGSISSATYGYYH